jgi:hypothetical protein
MNPTLTTTAGTALYEPTAAEYNQYLERRVQAATGLTVEQFSEAYSKRELDQGDPAVSEMIALLRIGQNGDRSSP